MKCEFDDCNNIVEDHVLRVGYRNNETKEVVEISTYICRDHYLEMKLQQYELDKELIKFFELVHLYF